MYPEFPLIPGTAVAQTRVILKKRLVNVKLRDHPQMTRRDGAKIWPPRWTAGVQPSSQWPIGEIGTLQEVAKPENLDSYLFLTIDYAGLSYFGIMHFDDAKFCEDIYLLLESKVGCPIKEIGDLDLLRTL